MKNIIFFSLIVLAVVIALVFAFSIKVKVECTSQYGECPEVIQSELNHYNSERMFFVKGKISKFLKGSLLVSDFSIQYKLPNIIRVEILVKKPVFAVVSSADNSAWQVDVNGMVLFKVGETNLPKIIANENLTVGGVVNNETFFALKIIQGVYSMYQVGVGNLGTDSLNIDLPGRINVIFPLEGDPQVLLGALRLLYTKVSSEEPRKYSQIDLRYKNPVLR